jgi:imidazolonepropionase-like amidohydrolase
MTGPTTPDPVVLRAPRLLDGTGAPAVPQAALLVEGGRIAYAGPAAGLPEGAAGAPVLDFPGATLLPGLVDAHVHLVASGGPDLAADVPRTEAERTLAAVVNARRQLEAPPGPRRCWSAGPWRLARSPGRGWWPPGRR